MCLLVYGKVKQWCRVGPAGHGSGGQVPGYIVIPCNKGPVPATHLRPAPHSVQTFFQGGEYMLSSEELQFFKGCIPFYDRLHIDEQRQLNQETFHCQIKKGEQITEKHEDCRGLVVVKSGRLRAYILSPDGREITLFRLKEKDICILSASCLFKNFHFTIYLEAEKDSCLYIVPALVIEELNQYNMNVKEFLLENIASRLSSAMWVMEQVVFGTLSQRVASFLLEQIQLEESKTLTITHEGIAKHIGSSREVVSRMLKYYERDHILESSRGKISICDFEKLQCMAK